MKWRFSRRSEESLRGIHPDLLSVVRRALEISIIDFAVIEGCRSLRRQQALVNAGVSWTLHSRHLTGHAVDLVPWVKNAIPWHDWPSFFAVAQAMQTAAAELQVPLIWGGDWEKYRDGPHFELPEAHYPSQAEVAKNEIHQCGSEFKRG